MSRYRTDYLYKHTIKKVDIMIILEADCSFYQINV